MNFIPNKDKCVEYVLGVLLNEITSDPDSLVKHIIYNNISSKKSVSFKVIIQPSDFFTSSIYGSMKSQPKVPLQEIENIPLLYGTPDYHHKNNNIIARADIIASSYYMLTRYEEIINTSRDKHGRFLGKHSLGYKAGILSRPIVNEYAKLLKKWIDILGISYPHPNRNYSIITTHDIDFFHYYWERYEPLRTIYKVLKGSKPIYQGFESVAVKLGLIKDPYDTLTYLYDVDKSVEAKTIFYLMSGHNHFLDGEDYYNSKTMIKYIEWMKKNEIQIGLHLSYNATYYPELIFEEKRKIEQITGQNITQVRFHYLTWRSIEDGYLLSDNGLNVDMSLGYPDICGFRLGICNAVKLFDPIKFQLIGVTEYPLLLMDGSLLLNEYMGLDKIEAFTYANDIINKVKSYSGILVILWHNSIFTQLYNKKWIREFYYSMLNEAKL